MACVLEMCIHTPRNDMMACFRETIQSKSFLTNERDLFVQSLIEAALTRWKQHLCYFLEMRWPFSTTGSAQYSRQV
jgi:hypothetical protein